MNSTQTNHPEIREGEILFCYADMNSFAAIGEDLRCKLRRGTHVPSDLRIARGVRPVDQFPCFVKVTDLDSGTLHRLGYNAQANVVT